MNKTSKQLFPSWKSYFTHKKTWTTKPKTSSNHLFCIVHCYQTLESWSRFRRVVSKVEFSPNGVNVRFVVTLQLPVPPGELYTQKYCPRGVMSNRFKEQQLELFSARTSTILLRETNFLLKSSVSRIWWMHCEHSVWRIQNGASGGYYPY